MIKRFSEFVAKYFNHFETLFVLSLTASLFMMYLEFSKAIYGVWVSLGLLALLYFVMQLRKFETKVAGIRIVMRRVVYLSYTFSTLAFMSALTFDDTVDTKSLSIFSLCLLGVSIVLLLLRRFKMNEKQEFFSNMLRCIVFGVLQVWLLMMFSH